MSEKCPVINYDHYGDEFIANRWEILKNLREECPIAYSESYGGYYVLSRYDDIRAVLGDPETFTSTVGPDGNWGDNIPQTIHMPLTPSDMDPPEHTKYRKALNEMFSRGAMEKWRPVIEGITSKVLDDLESREEFDAVTELGDVVPHRAIFAFLGLPDTDIPEFMAAMELGYATSPQDNPEAAAKFQALWSDLEAYVVRRRQEMRENPVEDRTQDMLTYLHYLEDPALDDYELLVIMMTLTLGGNHTTAALISNTLLTLEQDRELRQRLIDDPALISTAVHEFLRAFSPSVALARTVVKDTEIHGVQLKYGDRIHLPIFSGNLDETRFPQGREIDVDQASKHHVALGYGPHYCLGRFLAMIEFETVITMFLARFPDYSVEVERCVRTPIPGTFNAWAAMPTKPRG